MWTDGARDHTANLVTEDPATLLSHNSPHTLEFKIVYSQSKRQREMVVIIRRERGDIFKMAIIMQILKGVARDDD